MQWTGRRRFLCGGGGVLATDAKKGARTGIGFDDRSAVADRVVQIVDTEDVFTREGEQVRRAESAVVVVHQVDVHKHCAVFFHEKKNYYYFYFRTKRTGLHKRRKLGNEIERASRVGHDVVEQEVAKDVLFRERAD